MSRSRREAARTLRFYGEPAVEINDVGVAGLWRLLERIEEIRKMKVVIAVAGMDAALPTVIGGLVSSVVIGVPTSVGYGVATGGETALRAMLASCSPGLVVTNIDNGFGAACAALRILRAAVKKPGARGATGLSFFKRYFRSFFTASSAACAHMPSCSAEAPDTPMAPMCLPSRGQDRQAAFERHDARHECDARDLGRRFRRSAWSRTGSRPTCRP